MPPAVPAPQDLGAEIDDVRASTRAYIRANHAILFGTTTALCVAFAAVSGFFCYLILTSGLPDVDLRIIFVPIVPLMVPLMMYGYYQSRVQHVFIQQLAATLGFSYSQHADRSTVSGTFFDLGHSQSLADVMAGTHKNYPMRVYTYQYVTGSGKSQETHTYTVIEMRYGKPLPHVTMNLPEFGTPGGVERVELEGNFNDTFKLYVSTGQQMEIREIFQPDVMQDFLASLTGYSMEIYGDALYLMTHRTFSKRQDFLDMIAAVDTVLDDVLPGLEAVTHDEPVAPLTSSQASPLPVSP